MAGLTRPREAGAWGLAASPKLVHGRPHNTGLAALQPRGLAVRRLVNKLSWSASRGLAEHQHSQAQLK